MKFYVEIDCGNDAFADDTAGTPGWRRDAETARIIREIVLWSLEHETDQGGALFDINGNRVGTWGFQK